MLLKRIYDARSEGQRQFMKFGLVGGVGFVVDAGTFFLLTHYLGFGLVTARVMSSLVFGMTATWLLNRYLTFRNQRGGSILGQYLRFATANIIGNLLNIGTHALLVENLAFFHRSPLLGIVAGTIVGLVFNFTGSKYFVFRPASSQS
jgi:putative flippase GtrA